MAEFAIAAVPLMLLGLGCVETARWFYFKQALSLALLEAARAGSTQHAQPQAVQDAFETALRPLHPPTATHTAAERVRLALDERRRSTNQAPWRIRVVDPSAAAFTDFSDPGLDIDRQAGRRAINNNYQKEQHAAREARGWEGGVGPASGQTIYQANVLTLQLVYPLEPLVPGLRPLLQLLGAGSPGYPGRALAGGFLPITQEIQLTMQSHPMEWPDLPDGTVIHGSQPETAGQPHAPASCRGLWCPGGPAATPAGSGANPPSGTTPPSTDAAPAPGPSGTAGGTGPGSGPPDTDNGADGLVDTPPGDPACGVTLCCLG